MNLKHPLRASIFSLLIMVILAACGYRGTMEAPKPEVSDGSQLECSAFD
jgi:hypothetical protein